MQLCFYLMYTRSYAGRNRKRHIKSSAGMAGKWFFSLDVASA
jgi:hypothetical protein